MLDFVTSEMASALVWIIGNFSLLYDCITSQQMYRERLFADISSTFSGKRLGFGLRTL